MRLSRILAAVPLVAASLAARAGDDVVLGPGFVKGQVSAHALVYRVPDGWREDKEASKKNGLTAVLLPLGKTLADTKAAITIAFQRKDASKQGLATLMGFFRVDMENTLALYPDTEGVRWQPRGLDPDAVPFMSIELRPKGPKSSSPVRVLILDAGDGFYSVTLTTARIEALSELECVRFFDSLVLK